MMIEAVILCLIFISYYFFMISNEFKVEGNNQLYYLLFIISTLMIPVTMTVLDAYINTTENNVVFWNDIHSLNLMFWVLFSVLWMIMGVLLFVARLKSDYKKLEGMNGKKI